MRLDGGGRGSGELDRQSGGGGPGRDCAFLFFLLVLDRAIVMGGAEGV